MNYEKAIEELKKRYELGKADYMKDIPEYVEALGMAIDALEKQVPKKMDMYSEGHTGDLIYKCPTCGEAYNRFYEGKPHCMFCGQKILWEEEE